jgi:SAM-dependent methyltransferase
MVLKIAIQDEQGVNQVYATVGSAIERKNRRNEWFIKQMKALGAQNVLEIGCGDGEMADYIARNTSMIVTAIDISPTFIAQARNRFQQPNLSYELIDFMNFHLKPSSEFDFVFGNGILHHLVAQLPEVLKRLHSLIRSQGGMAFIEPNLLNPYCAFIFGTAIGRRWARLDPDEMAFSAGHIEGLLVAAGWQDISIATRDFLVPGLPASCAGPIKWLEPVLELTPLTSWLAQSNFIFAKV